MKSISLVEPDETGREVSSSAGVHLVHQKIYETLRHKIMIGDFVPGRSVTIRGLAKDLGVSSMPVREAMRRLVSERALVMHPNRRVSLAHMTKERFEQIAQARLILEPQAAVNALPFIEDSLIEEIESVDQQINQSLDAGVVTDYLKGNYRFHFLIYTAGGSDVLTPLIESLWLQFGPFMRMVFTAYGKVGAVDHHLEATQALRRRDSDALRRAVAADIESGIASIQESDFAV